MPWRRLFVPCLALFLGGCVHYHYTEPDVLIVSEPAPTVTTGVYLGTDPWYGYYPWWSMDWFYLGYGYGGPSYAWTIGGVYRYPYYDLYYPWYGWSPTYAWSYRYTPGWGYAWCPPPWRYPDLRHGHPGHRYGSEAAWASRYSSAPNRPTSPPGDLRRGIGDDPPRDFEDRWFDRGPADAGPPVRQSVLTRPVDGDGHAGLIVRSRGDQKPGPSRTQPVDARIAQPGSWSLAPPPKARSGVGQSRTQPVPQPGLKGYTQRPPTVSKPAPRPSMGTTRAPRSSAQSRPSSRSARPVKRAPAPRATVKPRKSSSDQR